LTEQETGEAITTNNSCSQQRQLLSSHDTITMQIDSKEALSNNVKTTITF